MGYEAILVFCEDFCSEFDQFWANILVKSPEFLPKIGIISGFLAY